MVNLNVELFKAFPTQMIITWTTLDFINETYVEYGIKNLDLVVIGSEKRFKNGDSSSREITMHQVLLNNLVPGQTYRYHCGSPRYGWSSIYYFTAMKPGSDWSPRFAVFGDMGNDNVYIIIFLKVFELFRKYLFLILQGSISCSITRRNNARLLWCNIACWWFCLWHDYCK